MVDPIGTVPALDCACFFVLFLVFVIYITNIVRLPPQLEQHTYTHILIVLKQDQLDQLFDPTNGYMSKVDETFNLLDTIHKAQALSTAKKNDKTDKSNNSNDKNGGQGDEASKHKRKHSGSALPITDKKTLVLDVDNTLIYVRHFMDEMRVNDEVKLGDKRARVKKLTYRLDFPIVAH